MQPAGATCVSAAPLDAAVPNMKKKDQHAVFNTTGLMPLLQTSRFVFLTTLKLQISNIELSSYPEGLSSTDCTNSL